MYSTSNIYTLMTLSFSPSICVLSSAFLGGGGGWNKFISQERPLGERLQAGEKLTFGQP